MKEPSNGFRETTRRSDQIEDGIRRAAPKVLTLAAYGYQAGLSLALIVVLANLMSGGEYKRFSLAFATAQFAAIGAFEWVRIAATRFYPGPAPERAPLQMASLGAAFAGAAGVGGVVALAALVFGVPPLLVGMAAVLALGQGLTDLHFTLIRFRGDLTAFSRLQSLRATLLLVGGVGGAWLGGSASGALSGLGLAYVLTIAIAAATDRSLRQAPWRSPSAALFRQHIAYGGPAAGASILYLGTVLGARYAISMIAPGAAAGVLLAFDLFQRPFAVVTTALHAILYPPVVAAYDRGGFAEARKPMLKLFGVEGACILILAALLAGAFAIPEVVALVAPEELRAAFFDSAFWAITLFAVRAVLVNFGPLALHLKRSVWLITVVSTADLAIFLAILAVMMTIIADRSTVPLFALTLSSGLGVLISCCVSFRVISRSASS